MAISVKTRKILWSKSGNRCAICKSKLIQKIVNPKADFILGEECHIISSKECGPRGNTVELDDYDTYDNLILLCANDHKLIDSFPETFTQSILLNLKENHEKWIEETIEKDLENYLKNINNIEVLEEVLNHNQLDYIIQNSHFYFFDSSSILDEHLSIEVSMIFENLRDLSDIYSDLDLANKNRYLIEILNSMKILSNNSIRFFGKPITRKYKFNNQQPENYKIAIIIAFDESKSPSSIVNGKLNIKLPGDFRPTF